MKLNMKKYSSIIFLVIGVILSFILSTQLPSIILTLLAFITSLLKWKEKNVWNILACIGSILFIGFYFASSFTTKEILNDAIKNSFRTEFLNLLQEVKNEANQDIKKGILNEKNPVKCYNSRNFNYNSYGTKLTYSVKAVYKNGDIQLIGWLSDDKLMILEKDENVLISNVQESKNKMVQEDCYLP